MKTIKYNNKEYTINCGDVLCDKCTYLTELKCSIYGNLLDRVVNNNPNISGVKRCQDCINDEINN